MENSPFTRGKILRHYDTIREFKETGVFPYPKQAIVYPSSVCNYRCSGCLCEGVNNIKGKEQFIDVEAILKVLREMYARGTRSVELAGGGEPTLHPEFKSLVQGIHAIGLQIGLLTNGSQLHKFSTDTISRMQYIRVSLSAWDEESYTQLHGVGGAVHKKLIAQLTKFITKTVRCCPTVTVGMKTLVSQHNLLHLYKLMQQARQMGAAYIQFKLLRNAEGSLSYTEVEAADALIEMWTKDIEDIEDAFDGGLAVYNGIVQSVEKRGWDIDIACASSLLHTLIDTNGDIFVCCYYSNRKVPIKFGNAFVSDFSSVWYGDQHKQVLRDLDVSECSMYDCRFCYYDTLFREALTNHNLHMDFL